MTSKLFYADPLSFHLSHAQVYRLQIFTICNDVLIRNCPMIFIQILNWLFLGNAVEAVAIMAFIFSLLSLIFGSLTVLSRCCVQRCQCEYHYREDRILLNIALKSNQIRDNHRYCHRKFAKTIASFLEVRRDRIETISIMEIYNGISCNVEILIEDIHDIETINRLVRQLSHNVESVSGKLKSVKCV